MNVESLVTILTCLCDKEYDSFWSKLEKPSTLNQSYEIKSPPWTIWWFRILGIFSVEIIDRLGAMMFQTSDNSQLFIDSQYSSQ